MTPSIHAVAAVSSMAEGDEMIEEEEEGAGG